MDWAGGSPLRRLPPSASIPPTPPPLRCWLRGVLGLAGFLGGLASGRATDDEPILILPKFTVAGKLELPPPESWRYAEFPGFVVLSNASDRETQRLFANFELFRLALGIVWPLPEQRSVPVSIIVCGARQSFEAFAPAAARPGTDAVSLLLHDREHGAIVLNAQSAVLVSSEATGDPTQDRVGFEVEPADLLQREYVRFLLSRKAQSLPVWMEEGMIQILLAMRVTRGQIVFGKVEDPKLGDSRTVPGLDPELEAEETDPNPPPPVEDRDFNYVFRSRRLMPLDKFFAVTRDSPEAGRIYGDNRWVKQAYAFVHMCLFGRGGRFQKPFATFLERASREPVTEAMVRECFGLDYRKLALELQLYVGFTDHQSKEYNFKKGKELPVPAPLVLREAAEFESARIKGDALLLGGHVEAAQAVLQPAYLRGARDPGLLATLGLAERAAGRHDRARRLLEAAVAGQVVRPEAYLELARLRYAEAAAAPAAGAEFSAGQVAGITRLLQVARHQPPHLPALYGLLAETWRRSAEPINRDDALALIQGAMLFPQNPGLVHEAADFARQAGLLDAARSLAAHGLKHAADAATRARFERLRALLPDGAPLETLGPGPKEP